MGLPVDSPFHSVFGDVRVRHRFMMGGKKCECRTLFALGGGCKSVSLADAQNAIRESLDYSKLRSAIQRLRTSPLGPVTQGCEYFPAARRFLKHRQGNAKANHPVVVDR